MRYKLSLAKEISRICTVCLAYVTLFVTILAIYHKSIPTPFWLLGIPCILICYQLIQNYCYHPILYIILHGILWIPVCLIPFSYTAYRYLFGILLFCEGLHAIQVWKTPTNTLYEDIPWHLFTCICLVYIITTTYHLDQFSLLIYYLGLGILLLHFIRFFITGLTKLFTKAEQATSMPANKIMLTGSFILVFFLLVLTLCAVGIKHSTIDVFFQAVGQMLIKLIRLIMQFISYIITILKALFAKDRQLDITDEAAQKLDDAWKAIQEPSLLARIIDGIITIAAIFIIVYIVYRIVISLLKIFSRKYAKDTDVIVQLSKPIELTHLPKNSISVLQRLQDYFRNTNATKIRKGYRLKIESYHLTNMKEHDTPTEIANHVQATHNEDISELTQVYEKARYSNEEITFEDVQKGGLL